MSGRDAYQELVMLFDSAGAKVELEMRLGQFNALLAQKAVLASHAASSVRAVYVQVGGGLTVRALVFFRFKVGEEGYVDPAFNLPLEYMALNAGPGPDLGAGEVAVACRSQCPVPWHAINMWEPATGGKSHPALLAQKVVWRNRLGLKPLPAAAADEKRRLPVALPPPDCEKAADAEARGMLGQLLVGAGSGTGRLGAGVRVLEDKLTATFGEAGRVSVAQFTRQHREQVGEVAEQFRGEMHRQQQGYLQQIRASRDEIQRLKSQLRHEQERNRRLKRLLRGDV